MKKINKVTLLSITSIIMILAGIAVPELNSSLWWTISTLMILSTIIVLIIPSREQRLKKIAEKNWKEKAKTG